MPWIARPWQHGPDRTPTRQRRKRRLRQTAAQEGGRTPAAAEAAGHSALSPQACHIPQLIEAVLRLVVNAERQRALSARVAVHPLIAPKVETRASARIAPPTAPSVVAKPVEQTERKHHVEFPTEQRTRLTDFEACALRQTNLCGTPARFRSRSGQGR